MESLTTTNVWLGILAVVSLLEFLMIAAAGVFAYKVYKQLMSTMETVERVHIAPLHARVDSILDQVQGLTDRVTHAEESVTDAVRYIAGTGSLVAGAVKSKAWPIIGVLQMLKVGAAAVMKNGKHHRADAAHKQSGAV